MPDENIDHTLIDKLTDKAPIKPTGTPDSKPTGDKPKADDTDTARLKAIDASTDIILNPGASPAEKVKAHTEFLRLKGWSRDAIDAAIAEIYPTDTTKDEDDEDDNVVDDDDNAEDRMDRPNKRKPPRERVRPVTEPPVGGLENWRIRELDIDTLALRRDDMVQTLMRGETLKNFVDLAKERDPDTADKFETRLRQMVEGSINGLLNKRIAAEQEAARKEGRAAKPRLTWVQEAVEPALAAVVQDLQVIAGDPRKMREKSKAKLAADEPWRRDLDLKVPDRIDATNAKPAEIKASLEKRSEARFRLAEARFKAYGNPLGPSSNV